MFSDCTNLSTIKSKKILDTVSTKCYNHNCQGDEVASGQSNACQGFESRDGRIKKSP